MAEPDNQRRGDKGSSDDKLYTLSEVSKKTGISMPTLQRYKKLYQGRIPSVGSGRKQRYPEGALPVFDEIKNENIGRRGRPRKDASAPAQRVARGGRGARGNHRAAQAGRRGGRPAAAAKGARRGRPKSERGNLMTLTQVSEQTGISYPTLVRYVRLYSDRLPHEGKGRARRFYPDAVDVFRQIRQESGRGGRKPGTGARRGSGSGRGGGEAALSGRLRAIEKSQQTLEKRFRAIAKSLQKLFK
jgi:DNA-binding transcriptional MerR regulator